MSRCGVSKGVEEIGNKKPTIRNNENCIFVISPVVHIVSPAYSSYCPSRDSTQNNLVSLEEGVLLLEIVKMGDCVIGASEMKICSFIWDRC